ncbi:uncharacterized protein LOC131208651 [Anopheles bellator]|uniref:uncharacterized protein LOC131208651 n=1 Tax=Anopheles bellator TaxID=139047 RepID=UPI00264A054C|nr:uncharacterized protein LOC131208651 [Anopheles bellator]
MGHFEPREIVNGSLLKRHIDKPVSIHLKVEEAANGCKSLSGKSTDGMDVLVHLSEPLNGKCSGWVEVIGVVDAQGSVRGKEIVTYFNNGDKVEDFDVDGHNMMCTFLSVCKDPFPCEG